jgi:hypothetical protein
MKIRIELQDTESGKVQIELEPKMETLMKMARDKNVSPATAYSMRAIRAIMVDAVEQAGGIEKASGVQIPENPKAIQ